MTKQIHSSPVAPNQPKGPLVFKIGDKWINVEAWKKVHPGGAACLERFAGEDATDAFESLHSKEAFEMVKKMKDVTSSVAPEIIRQSHKPTEVSFAFRKFRAELEAEGWFVRNWYADAIYISLPIIFCMIGTFISYQYPVLATLLIGLGMQQAGWVGHDYVHGRGSVAKVFGDGMGGLINGFSSRWWSEKHNKHHVHTNQFGVDDDIANDPILHLWIPEPEKDVAMRAYQHLYYHIVYSFLFVSWRIQSFQHAWARSDKLELALMAINYTWLLLLPLPVSISAIFVGGFLVAEIVTVTHQSEEIIEGMSWDYAEDQFRTTRDVVCQDFVQDYIWGGMQFQLEHHLFPTMPKYRYKALIPRVKEFAKKNGLDYRTSGVMEMFRLNYETMKKFAAPSGQKSKNQ